MIWNPFRQRKSKAMSEERKMAFAEAIANLLKIQLHVVSKKTTIESETGGPKPKANGYVYGFVDAALGIKGWNMADAEIGIPITFHVLRLLWLGKEREYIDFLFEHLSDPLVVTGCMHGGQQYLDSLKEENSGNVPMGLARYILTEP